MERIVTLKKKMRAFNRIPGVTSTKLVLRNERWYITVYFDDDTYFYASNEDLAPLLVKVETYIGLKLNNEHP